MQNVIYRLVFPLDHKSFVSIILVRIIVGVFNLYIAAVRGVVDYTKRATSAVENKNGTTIIILL